MIVATAGHVDHGKTYLVKNLTGMDTDRLEEEKRRGLSINLGFAYRKLDPRLSIGFIDVPGHHKFINNMISGIHGIDLGMLVIAADDGPMPQSREHLNILNLLGVTRFVLVISKIDRVDTDKREFVRDAALKLFSPTTLPPVFEISNTSGEGIEELQAYLDQQAREAERNSSPGYFRLSIDRAFLIKGAGLVVTGTITSGSVKVGDALKLVPQNINVRIRSLQVQDKQCEQASAGQRCALNIKGNLGKDEIERGDWLVDIRSAFTTLRFDGRVSMLADAEISLKHMAPIKLYIGAKRIAARLALLESKKIMSGDEALVQLIVKRGLHCCHGDRFLIRDDSETQTLGGGIVLDQRPPMKKRASKLRLNTLLAIQEMTAEHALERLLFEFNQTVNIEHFCSNWNIHDDNEPRLLKLGGPDDSITLINSGETRIVVSSTYWQQARDFVIAELTSHQQSRREKNGQLVAELKAITGQKFSGIDLDLLLEQLSSAGAVNISKNRITLGHQEEPLSDEEQLLWLTVEKYLHNCELKLPVISDMAVELDVELESILKTLTKKKYLFKISDKRIALPEQLVRFADTANSLGKGRNVFSVANFKKETNIGRNLAVEVLEYFDNMGFTARKDSGRVVVKADRLKTLIKQ